MSKTNHNSAKTTNSMRSSPALLSAKVRSLLWIFEKYEAMENDADMNLLNKTTENFSVKNMLLIFFSF